MDRSSGMWEGGGMTLGRNFEHSTAAEIRYLVGKIGKFIPNNSELLNSTPENPRYIKLTMV